LKNENIFTKPGDEDTEKAIKTITKLKIEKELTFKPKVLINNVDSQLTKKEILKSLLRLNEELSETETQDYNIIVKRIPIKKLIRQQKSFIDH
jgi:hypothetical protein